MDPSDRYCNPPFRITRVKHVCLTVRDPDAARHRLELILTPMQVVDAEEPTHVRTSADKHMIVRWGSSAPERWVEEATAFTGVPLNSLGNFARWASR